MSGSDRYVAYVSTYTMNDNHGIIIYDVDIKKGRFQKKSQIEITNSSYLTISHNQKFLYSITDFGVESFKILKDGSLKLINHASINGMRGCYLSTDYEDKFLFVAGYHDGKITVLRLGKDGGVGEITDEISIMPEEFFNRKILQHLCMDIIMLWIKRKLKMEMGHTNIVR